MLETNEGLGRGSDMGMLVRGRWEGGDLETLSSEGRFVRGEAAFRGQLVEGTPHPPAVGRYHLYVSLA
ncbi:MAG TPA: hypothetical protein VMF89_10965, partial [Polyangiales bacterium]|nr:hypothetical protein [Polyangiales bacterium]